MTNGDIFRSQEVAAVDNAPDFQLKNEETDWGSLLVRRKYEVSYGLFEVDADYTVRRNDRYIIADGLLTVTIPDSDIGKVYTIKNVSVSTVTVDGGNSNIDGVGTQTLTSQYESITIVKNATEWSIVAQI